MPGKLEAVKNFYTVPWINRKHPRREFVALTIIALVASVVCYCFIKDDFDNSSYSWQAIGVSAGIGLGTLGILVTLVALVFHCVKKKEQNSLNNWAGSSITEFADGSGTCNH